MAYYMTRYSKIHQMWFKCLKEPTYNHASCIRLSLFQLWVAWYTYLFVPILRQISSETFLMTLQPKLLITRPFLDQFSWDSVCLYWFNYIYKNVSEYTQNIVVKIKKYHLQKCTTLTLIMWSPCFFFWFHSRQILCLHIMSYITFAKWYTKS